MPSQTTIFLRRLKSIDSCYFYLTCMVTVLKMCQSLSSLLGCFLDFVSVTEVARSCQFMLLLGFA